MNLLFVNFETDRLFDLKLPVGHVDQARMSACSMLRVVDDGADPGVNGSSAFLVDSVSEALRSIAPPLVWADRVVMFGSVYHTGVYEEEVARMEYKSWLCKPTVCLQELTVSWLGDQWKSARISRDDAYRLTAGQQGEQLWMTGVPHWITKPWIDWRIWNRVGRFDRSGIRLNEPVG